MTGQCGVYETFYTIGTQNCVLSSSLRCSNYFFCIELFHELLLYFSDRSILLTSGPYTYRREPDVFTSVGSNLKVRLPHSSRPPPNNKNRLHPVARRNNSRRSQAPVYYLPTCVCSTGVASPVHETNSQFKQLS